MTDWPIYALIGVQGLNVIAACVLNRTLQRGMRTAREQITYTTKDTATPMEDFRAMKHMLDARSVAMTEYIEVAQPKAEAVPITEPEPEPYDVYESTRLELQAGTLSGSWSDM